MRGLFIRLMLQAFFSSRTTEQKNRLLFKKREKKNLRLDVYMSILKVIYTYFGIYGKWRKNERKKIVTQPTTESQLLLMKWCSSCQSFLSFFFLVKLLVYCFVWHSWNHMNSSYLKTKTHSFTWHMALCAELKNDSTLLML